MLTTQISSPQVAIAGRVLNGETQKPIAGAEVKITYMPDQLWTYLPLKKLQYGSQWEKMSNRPDKKVTSNDGSFYFVHLPPGDYTLLASLPGSGTRYGSAEEEVTVPSASSIDKIIPPMIADDDGRTTMDIIQTQMVDIFLVPTGIKGNIYDQNDPTTTIPHAKVQVQGTLEIALSDQNGDYSLLGLETPASGTVTLTVTATGYQEKGSQAIKIQQGKVKSGQDFPLVPQKPPEP